MAASPMHSVEMVDPRTGRFAAMRADPAFIGYFEYLAMRQVTKDMVIEKMKAKGVEADAIELFTYGVEHGLHKPQAIEPPPPLTATGAFFACAPWALAALPPLFFWTVCGWTYVVYRSRFEEMCDNMGTYSLILALPVLELPLLLVMMLLSCCAPDSGLADSTVWLYLHLASITVGLVASLLGCVAVLGVKDGDHCGGESLVYTLEVLFNCGIVAAVMNYVAACVGWDQITSEQ